MPLFITDALIWFERAHVHAHRLFVATRNPDGTSYHFLRKTKSQRLRSTIFQILRIPICRRKRGKTTLFAALN